MKTTLIFAALLIAASVHGADWPTYRGNHARTAATAENLKFPLSENWEYVPSQPHKQAWPEMANTATNHVEMYRWLFGIAPPDIGTDLFARPVQFDVSPQPTVVGGLVYAAFSSDDTVRAFDAVSGKIAWTFTAGGPTRFAPEIADGLAYIACDDGVLYCLDAKTGKEQWRYQHQYSSRMLIGNGRMISRQPLRGGVIVESGAVYLPVGMWPMEVSYVVCLDARTGETRWMGDNYLAYRNTHGAASNLAGLSTQGYMLFSQQDKWLFVSEGRTLPAIINAENGNLISMTRTVISTNSGLGSDKAVLDLPNKRILFDMHSWAGKDKDGKELVGYAVASAPLTLHREWTGEMAFKPDIAGAFRLRYIAVDNGVYGWNYGKLSGPDWNVSLPEKMQVYTLIKAGDALILGGDGLLYAYSAKDGSPLWQTPTDGKVYGLAVSAGRLIATTDRGNIHCYGAKAGTTSVIRDPAGPINDTATTWVADLLPKIEAARMTKGFALILGAPDAKSAEQLARKTALSVICALTDKTMADSERARLVNADLPPVRFFS